MPVVRYASLYIIQIILKKPNLSLLLVQARSAFGVSSSPSEEVDGPNQSKSTLSLRKSPLVTTMRKKVYGPTLEDRFVFEGWKDATDMIASVDRRARAAVRGGELNQGAKIKKITLTKLLVFGSGESRDQVRASNQLSDQLLRYHVNDR